MHLSLILGALIAAPLFSQSMTPQESSWFLKLENKDQVIGSLGKPAVVADFGIDFRSWQYQLGTVEHDEFSHNVVIRKSTGDLVSVTRNFDPQVNVDVLFPAVETQVCQFPAPDKPQFSVRVRRLTGGRILLAIGTSKAGQVTGQVAWMRESELRTFYPWVAEQLAKQVPEQ